MKILMAAPFDPKGRYQGGISSVVNELLDHKDCLEQNDLEIIKYETCRTQRDKKSTSKFSIENLKNAASIYFTLSKIAKQNQPDLIYYHSSTRWALFKDLLALRRAKIKTKIKTALHIHFAEYSKIMTGEKWVDAFILRLLRKYIDKIVFLSKETQNEFIAHGIAQSKTALIYNFSALDITESEQKIAAENVNKKCKFLFIGSYDKRKGICDLLECFTKLHQDQFELHICGGYGDLSIKNEVENLIHQLGSSVIEHGYVKGDEKKRIYLDTDVLLLPSYGEGLPLVILEAYQAACAVISTEVGAVPEIVSIDNGFLIQPGDKEALLIYIKLLIEKPYVLAAMKIKNANESKKYTIEQFIANIADVCKGCRQET